MEQKADSHIRNNKGETALDLAAQFGHVEVVRRKGRGRGRGGRGGEGRGGGEGGVGREGEGEGEGEGKGNGGEGKGIEGRGGEGIGEERRGRREGRKVWGWKSWEGRREGCLDRRCIMW